MLVAVWFRIRDAAVRAVVPWSTLQGTRRQLSAAVTVLVLDATLIQPEDFGLHFPFAYQNLTEEANFGRPVSVNQCSVAAGSGVPYSSLPELPDEETN